VAGAILLYPDQDAPGESAPERLLDVQVIGDVDLGELVLGTDLVAPSGVAVLDDMVI
jgi:hypothetical protein